ncbi:MAG: phosphoribosylformylglycinamidine synthase I [Candidatus Helarchaeota archaeon]
MIVPVVQFPGSNCDLDTIYILKKFGIETRIIWHKEFNSHSEFDGVILPGGFSYGDHLRAGIIAAYSPAMDVVKQMAKEGKPVLGICNGFQILVEAGLLPGALIKNNSLTFICKWVILRTETNRTAFTNEMSRGEIIHIPIAHGEGRYFNEKQALKEMYENDQIVFKYSKEDGNITDEANPNGSIDNIAGICNLEGNVVGLMPHPERASEKILSPYNSDEGKLFFKSLIAFIKKKNS